MDTTIDHMIIRFTSPIRFSLCCTLAGRTSTSKVMAECQSQQELKYNPYCMLLWLWATTEQQSTVVVFFIAFHSFFYSVLSPPAPGCFKTTWKALHIDSVPASYSFPSRTLFSVFVVPTLFIFLHCVLRSCLVPRVPVSGLAISQTASITGWKHSAYINLSLYHYNSQYMQSSNETQIINNGPDRL